MSEGVGHKGNSTPNTVCKLEDSIIQFVHVSETPRWKGDVHQREGYLPVNFR